MFATRNNDFNVSVQRFAESGVVSVNVNTNVATEHGAFVVRDESSQVDARSSPPLIHLPCHNMSLSAENSASHLTRPVFGPPAYSTLSPNARRKISSRVSPLTSNVEMGGVPDKCKLGPFGHVIAAVVCFWPMGLVSWYYYRKAIKSGFEVYISI